MSFTESLRKIMEDLEEAQGIALVGTDGIVVEERKRDTTIDLPSLGAEYCTILKMTDKGMFSMGLGNSEEMSVLTEKAVVVIRRVHEEYFLLLAIRKEGNFGKARYLLRREGMNLKGEF